MMPTQKQKYTCPCCGYITLEEKPGHFDICRICFWEDDNIQRENPLYEGGANAVSLKQAQRNFLKYGACEERFLKEVKKLEDCDIKDISFKIIK